MKCSKCGENCRSNQAFCVKCGTPIHVVPDFNLIEAELANSIGKLLNEDKKDSVFIKKNEEEEQEYVEKQDYDLRDQKNEEEAPLTQKEKKRRIIMISLISAVILIVILIISIVLSNKENTFTAKYDRGMEYYNDGEYESALKEMLSANKLAETNSEKIKAKEALWDTYSKMGENDQNIIVILKELIQLNPKEAKYYEALVILYIDNGMEEEAQELINAIEDKDIYDLVSGYGVAPPIASIVAGEYDKYITVELSSTNAECIYYTFDGSEPKQTSTLYEAPIEINTEGKTTLKAIAVSSSGLISKVVQVEYMIQLSELTAPTVTPKSGEYSQNTKITVSGPSGATIYYTFDGTIPSSNSVVYSGPIDMPRGNNVFKVIAINQGITSSVVTNIYNLVIPQNYSIDQAINLLKDNFVNEGKMNDKKGSSNNDKYNFTYKQTTIKDNNEYFIIQVDTLDNKNNVKSTNYYGVNTATGIIKTVSSTATGQYSITN